jgi:cell division septation protein DedD/CheY-like chemotaxis protein
MASETTLIIDAGQDIDQRMTTTLEAESYLVYTVSSQDVNAEMAELLKPSLIYIRPLELSPAGLKPCKAIHDIPLLKKIPIIILASPEKALDPNYFKDYGIVDFLEPTFGPEDLIEKTRTILDKTPPSGHSKEDEPAASPQRVRRKEKKRSALLLPAIGIVVLLVIAGGGFLAYQQFMPTRKVPPSPPVKAPSRVPSAAPEAGSKSQLPPAKSVAERPAPPSPAPSAAPEAGSKSQLPPAKSIAERPAPPSPVPPAPPEAGSKSQLPPAKSVADASARASSVPSTPPGQPSSLSSVSASQPPRKPFYSVQLGAFKNESNAQALRNKFREKGYDAFTQPGVTKDRSPIYRVLVSKYEDRKAAEKLAGEIQSKEGIKTTLYGE